MTSTTPTHLADRALIRLSGDDPAGFLQGLVTQDVTGALPVWSGLLTAQGKTLFDFLVWPDGAGGLLIDCEAIGAEALCKRLTLYRLRRQIVIEPVPEMAVHWAPAGDAGVPDPRLAELGRLIDPRDDDMRCYALPARGLQARIGCATLPAGIQWTGLPAPLGGPLP